MASTDRQRVIIIVRYYYLCCLTITLCLSAMPLVSTNNADSVLAE